jgi:hypothetical protein
MNYQRRARTTSRRAKTTSRRAKTDLLIMAINFLTLQHD